MDKTINNLMWGGDLPPPVQPNVTPTLGGGPSTGGMAPTPAGPGMTPGAAAGAAAAAAGGVGGGVPRKGSWFRRGSGAAAAAAPPVAVSPPVGPAAAGVMDGSGGVTPAAGLPAVGTWAGTATAAGGGAAPGGGPHPHPHHQQQQQQSVGAPTWGPQGMFPSPAPPQSASATSGFGAPNSPAGFSGSSSSGYMGHHQRNMSQQSFTAAGGGGWAGLQQLTSFSDAASSTHH